MNSRDLALKTVEAGGWIFDDLAPQFRSALIRRIGDAQDGRTIALESRSLTELTLLAYDSEIPRAWKGFEINTRFLFPIRDSETAFVSRRLASKVYDGGTPNIFNADDMKPIMLAENFLSQVAPEVSALRERWVPSFMKLANVPFRSGSHPHAFGCIFFGDRIKEFTEKEVAVSIVHEMAHQELFLFNLLDRLVEAEADYKLVHAPFQGTMRPTIGRLHSLYALFRMVEFEQRAGLSSDRHADLLFATAGTFGPRDLTEYGMDLVSAIIKRTKFNRDSRNAVSL